MVTTAEMDSFLTRAFLRYFRAGTGAGFAVERLRRDQDLSLLRCLWAFSSPLVELYRYLDENRHEIRAVLQQTVGKHDAVVRGPLLTSRTLIERTRTGHATMVLFNEPQRSLDNGPNRVLLWVLQEASDYLRQATSAFDSMSTYRENAVEGERLLERGKRSVLIEEASRALGRLPRPSSQAALQALRSRQALYRIAERAYRLIIGVESLDVAALTAVLSETIIGPLKSWQRFELVLALSMAEALANALGCSVDFMPIGSGGSASPVFRAGRFDIFWQQRTSVYAEPVPEPSEVVVQTILDAYGITAGSDRPDVVVYDREVGKVVSLAEAKLTDGSDEGVNAFRAATSQLVRYSRGYQQTNAVLSCSIAAVSNLDDEVAGLAIENVPIARNSHSLISSSLGIWAARVIRTFS